MSDLTFSAQRRDKRRVSRGFHRLGIFGALLSAVVCAAIGAQKYDGSGWIIGGLVLAPLVYALSRLAGWTVNGFSDDASETGGGPAPAHKVIPPQNPPIPQTNTTQTPARNRPTDLRGLGGWLVLLGFGLVVAPFRSLFGVIETLKVAANIPAGTPLPLTVFIYVEVAANISLMAGGLYVLFLFFKERRQFASAFIALTCANLFVTITDLFVANAFFKVALTNDDLKQVVTIIVYMLIWVPYVLFSKRVQATFVNEAKQGYGGTAGARLSDINGAGRE